MEECCQCECIEGTFNRKRADADLRRYHRKGPAKTTQALINALKNERVEGLTLLDIGGGIGAIQHELFGAGVVSATHVDAASAHIEVAKEESERRGKIDRVGYHHGDFVALAPDIEQADIVTLDRVICCYHDMESLVRLSLAKARSLYGLVYPRTSWWIKISWRALKLPRNIWPWIQRKPFRSYFHDSKAVDDVARSSGFDQLFYCKTGIWQIVVYGRRNPPQ